MKKMDNDNSTDLKENRKKVEKEDVDGNAINNDSVVNKKNSIPKKEEFEEHLEEESHSYDAEDIEKQNQATQILNDKIEDLLSSLKKERADFQNYKKRSIEEKYALEDRIGEKILVKLLPSLDTFDAFFQNIEKIDKVNKDDLTKGVLLIKKQILSVFQEMGFEELNPKGEEFDPNSMEALTVEEEGSGKEIVKEVYQPGYRIHKKVIRPARVKVKRPKKD